MSGAYLSVAMTTYNGGQYLCEQLESLVNQDQMPCELVVGDDCSTDNTMDILNDFKHRAPFEVVISRNNTNKGYADNFLATARRCRGAWIAFCDQDDYWLPTKISDCMERIDGNPQLCQVLQKAELCDPVLGRSGRTFPEKGSAGTYHARSHYGFWVWPGFLQTVRADLIRDYDYHARPTSYITTEGPQPHDKMTCMLSNAVGDICITESPSAFYRRHEQTVTGTYSKKTWTDKIRGALETRGSHYAFLANAASDAARFLDDAAHTSNDSELTVSLQTAAKAYTSLAGIQSTRSKLYSSRHLWARLQCYVSIYRSGGYIGPAFTAMGYQSAVKDGARTLFGPQLEALQ